MKMISQQITITAIKGLVSDGLGQFGDHRQVILVIRRQNHRSPRKVNTPCENTWKTEYNPFMAPHWVGLKFSDYVNIRNILCIRYVCVWAIDFQIIIFNFKSFENGFPKNG